MTTITVEIPEFKFEAFEEKIAKLNRKAKKLNLPETQYSITNEFEKEFSEGPRKFKIKFLVINIIPHEVKYGEYTFLGTVDRTQENGLFINPVPGKTIPEQYYNSPNHCDHCNTQRYRTETFIFQDNNGTKQVGRTCLKEFFGIDPIKEIELLQSVYSFIKEYNDESYDGYSRWDEYFDISYILSIGIAHSKDFGFVSSKMAQEDDEKVSTKNEVISILFPGKHPDIQAFSREYLNKAESYTKQANTIINWAKQTFTNNTEFEHNIRNILNSNSVSIKYFGYLLSLIPLHFKATENQKETQNINNNYYGVEKEKIQFEMECRSVYQMESHYGFVTIITFINNDGYIFVWYASGAHDEFEKGNKYNIKATIKTHKEYKGTKQTVITRAKIV